MKDRKNDAIAGKFANGLKKALERRGKSPEEAAQLLKVELGTMYKYLAGDMIPGGQVLWLACIHLDIVLDRNGLKVPRRSGKYVPKLKTEGDQYELFPFINESFEGDKIQANVRKKDNQYVQVMLKIKVAG